MIGSLSAAFRRIDIMIKVLAEGSNGLAMEVVSIGPADLVDAQRVDAGISDDEPLFGLQRTTYAVRVDRARQLVSIMKDLTKETMDFAAARHLADGFNFRAYTPHKIAHELLRWDKEFKDADYTELVAAVKLWQSSSRG